MAFKPVSRSILHGYKLILTSLLVSMGMSTFASKEFVIFCRVSKIGNVLYPPIDCLVGGLDVILPIDELIFFKMVIAPPTSYSSPNYKST